MTDAGRCPSCGRPVRPASLFLDPLPPPTGHDHEPEPLPREPGPTAAPLPVPVVHVPAAPPDEPPVAPGKGNRRVAVAVVLAVVLAAGATVASIAGSTSPDGTETAADTSTTSTTARRTTTTRRGAVATATTSTTLVLAVPAGAPGGTLLLGTPSGKVYRADLSTGRADLVKEALGALREAWDVQLVSGHLIAALPRGVVALSPDDLAIRTDLGAANAFFVGGDRVWLVDFAEGPPAAREVRFGPDTTEIGSPVRLPPGSEVRGASEGGLILQLGGQAFVYDPERGVGEPLPAGAIVAAARDRVARIVCDRRLTCRLEVSDLDGNTIVAVSHPEDGTIDPWMAGSFSPDGSRLWVAVTRSEAPPTPMFVDVESGAVTVVEAGMSWQGNGSWLGNWALVPTGEGVLAVGPAGEIVPLGDRALGVVQWVVAYGS